MTAARSIGVHNAKRARAPIPRESEVQAGILVLLAYHPRIAWAERINTGATIIGERFIRFGFKGCSDILGQLCDGRFLAIEVKRPGEHATLEQREFIDRVNQHHGAGAIVHSIDEAVAFLAGVA